MKKLLKDILQMKSPSYLFNLLDSLINSDYPVDEKLFASENGYEFLEEIFDHKLYHSYNTDYTNLEKLLEHISQYTHPSLDINKFFNDNINYMQLIIESSLPDKELLIVIKALDFNKISIENRNKILKWSLVKPAPESFTYIIKNYKINADELVFYTAKKYEGKTKITKSSPLNFLEINNFQQLQLNYNAYVENFDFSSVSHSKFYNTQEVDNEEQMFKTPGFHEEYNNLFYVLIKKYSERFERVYKSKKHTRQEQKNMKEWALEVEKVVDFFNTHKINYYGEEAGLKQCFNLSLISMAMSFPYSLKNILKNKDLIRHIDLSIKDINGNNLVIALLKNAEIDLVNKLLKINNKTTNDIFYKEDNHLMASLNSTILAFNKGKISKSIFKDITEFINRVASATDWSYNNSTGNILAQYLSIAESTEFALKYNTTQDKLSVDKRDEYINHFFDLYLTLFLSKKLSFSDSNANGVLAQDYLFDNYLMHNNYTAREYFLQGSEKLGIKGYNSYTTEEKKNYLLNFIERVPNIVGKKEVDGVFNREMNSILYKMKDALGFMKDRELTDNIARKMVNIPFYDKIKSSTSEQYIELSECRVLLEKFTLLKTLEVEKIPAVKRINKL